MEDKQNQPEFMVASMWVAHKQSSFHCVYTHFFSCPLSKKQLGAGSMLHLVTSIQSCGLKTVFALLQMGGIFIGTILIQ